jgi:hypothetical protein
MSSKEKLNSPSNGLLKEINDHLENIIYRLNNFYDISKYQKIFLNYGKIENLNELLDMLNKLNIKIEEETKNATDIYNKVKLNFNDLEKNEKGLFNQKIDLYNDNPNFQNKEEYDKINLIIQNKIENEINPYIKYLKEMNDLVESYNKIYKEKSLINLEDDDFKLIEKITGEEKSLSIDKIFERINLNEIYNINNEIINIKSELINKFDFSKDKWYKTLKGGNDNLLEYTNNMYKYLEAITELKKNYSNLLLNYNEYNKLASEWILYLLLILELYKKINNGYTNFKRYLTKKDIENYKKLIKSYIIFENDIFTLRIKKILDFLGNRINNKYLDIYESPSYQLDLLLLNMIFLE